MCSSRWRGARVHGRGVLLLLWIWLRFWAFPCWCWGRGPLWPVGPWGLCKAKGGVTSRFPDIHTGDKKHPWTMVWIVSSVFCCCYCSVLYLRPSLFSCHPQKPSQCKAIPTSKLYICEYASERKEKRDLGLAGSDRSGTWCENACSVEWSQSGCMNMFVCVGCDCVWLLLSYCPPDP